METDDQTITTFLEIVNSNNYEEAKFFNKEAVNLYFSVHDESTQQNTQQQPIQNLNQVNYNQQDRVNTPIELGDEQKEYLSKKIKFENRKKEYEKNQSGFIGQSVKNIMTWFSGTNTTASQFVEKLQFKPIVDVLDMDLDDTISNFDLKKHKSILIIYIRPSSVSKDLENIEKQILQNQRFQEICEKAVFTGVIQNTKTQYNLQNKIVPCFVVIYRDKLDELIEAVPIEFQPRQQSSGQILEQIERNVNNAQEILNCDKQFIEDTKKVVKHNKKIMMQRQMNNMYGFNQHNIFNTLDHQRVIQESERLEQERLLRQLQDQYQNSQNLEQERKNIQLEEERRLKREQERKYQEMLQNQQQQEQVQKKEQTQQENRQQKINRLKKKFENRKLSENQITFAIRLPNGQRVTQQFEKDDKTEEVYDLVYIQEIKGFQDEDHEFEVYSCGFPPVKLEKEKKLKEYFGESDQEALTIREIFEQLT